jgi:hypothetical protein
MRSINDREKIAHERRSNPCYERDGGVTKDVWKECSVYQGGKIEYMLWSNKLMGGNYL